MKTCAHCSSVNFDEATSCKKCGGKNFIVNRLTASPAMAVRPAIPARSSVVLICLCVLGLVGEVIGRQMHYQRLAARLTAERTQADQTRTDFIAEQDQAAKAQVAAEEAEDQSRLQDNRWLSGTMARERHEKEWAARLNHDPQLATSVLETNLLAMEQLGQIGRASCRERV